MRAWKKAVRKTHGISCYHYHFHMYGTKLITPVQGPKQAGACCLGFFINAVLLAYSPAIFVSVLSVAAFALQGQSWVVATKARGPRKPKLFTLSRSFTGKHLPSAALRGNISAGLGLRGSNLHHCITAECFFVVLKYLFDHAVQHVLISVPWPRIEPSPCAGSVES